MLQRVPVAWRVENHKINFAGDAFPSSSGAVEFHKRVTVGGNDEEGSHVYAFARGP